MQFSYFLYTHRYSNHHHSQYYKFSSQRNLTPFPITRLIPLSQPYQSLISFLALHSSPSGSFLWVESCTMWSSVTKPFHLGKCFQGLPTLSHISALNSLLWPKIPFVKCVHLSVNGHLCGLHPLSNINKAAINICVQVSVWTSFITLRYITRNGVGLTFWKTAKLFSRVSTPFALRLHQQFVLSGSEVLTYSRRAVLVVEMPLHTVGKGREHLSCAYLSSGCRLWWCSCSDRLLVFKLGCLLSFRSSLRILDMLKIQAWCQICDLEVFSLMLWLSILSGVFQIVEVLNFFQSTTFKAVYFWLQRVFVGASQGYLRLRVGSSLRGLLLKDTGSRARCLPQPQLSGSGTWSQWLRWHVA